MSPNRILSTIVLLALVLPAQQVLRVGPSRPYQSIQVAHDAAAAGDRIFVDAGSYAEKLTLTKGVAIFAATDAWTSVLGPVTWRGIGVGQAGTIAGFDILSWTNTHGQAAGVVVEDCAGLITVAQMRFRVRLEPISKCGWNVRAGPWVRALHSNVLVSRCRWYGETIGLSHVGHAMGSPAFEADASQLWISACQGYDYGPTPVPLRAGLSYVTYYTSPQVPPVPLLTANDSVVVLENTTIGGGDGDTHPLVGPGIAIDAVRSTVLLGGVAQILGGDARASGVSGGDAIHCQGTLVYDRVTIAGGAGSPPGGTVVGTIPLALHVPDLLGPADFVPTGGRIDWTARGRAGDAMVWLAFLQPQPLVLWGVHGVLGSASPLLALPATFPAGETLQQSLQLGTEGSLLGLTLYVQVATVWSASVVLSTVVPVPIR